MSAENRLNPHQWAYRKHFTGGVVNPIAFSVMTQKYHADDIKQLMESFCSLLKYIAVQSSLLTPHQRRKYEAQKLNQSKWVYYLFPEESVPYDVYVRIEPEEGKHIYALPDRGNVL